MDESKQNLWNDNEEIIIKYCGKILQNVPANEYNDWKNELLLSAFMSIDKWDADGRPFKSYAYQAMVYRLMDLRKQYNNIKRKENLFYKKINEWMVAIDEIQI